MNPRAVEGGQSIVVDRVVQPPRRLGLRATTADSTRSAPREPRNPDPEGPGVRASGMSRDITRVREEGLEPSRPCGHRNLNPARLPIPPLARVDS